LNSLDRLKKKDIQIPNFIKIRAAMLCIGHTAVSTGTKINE